MKPNYNNFSSIASTLKNPKDSLPRIRSYQKIDPLRADSMATAPSPRCATRRCFPTSECTPENSEDDGDAACPPPHIISYSDKDKTAKPRSRSLESAPAPVVPSSKPSGPSAHHHGLEKQVEIGGTLIFAIPAINHPNNPFVPSEKIGDEKEVAQKESAHVGEHQNAHQNNVKKGLEKRA